MSPSEPSGPSLTRSAIPSPRSVVRQVCECPREGTASTAHRRAPLSGGIPMKCVAVGSAGPGQSAKSVRSGPVGEARNGRAIAGPEQILASRPHAFLPEIRPELRIRSDSAGVNEPGRRLERN